MKNFQSVTIAIFNLIYLQLWLEDLAFGNTPELSGTYEISISFPYSPPTFQMFLTTQQ